jgi:anti-sigma B factor antagonist
VFGRLFSELEAAFQKCRQEGKHQIVVNGARLRYIFSAGLGAFLGAIDAVRQQGGDIKIATLTPHVFNVFDMLGFPLLFDLVATEEEAIALFDPSRKFVLPAVSVLRSAS